MQHFLYQSLIKLVWFSCSSYYGNHITSTNEHAELGYKCVNCISINLLIFSVIFSFVRIFIFAVNYIFFEYLRNRSIYLALLHFKHDSFTLPYTCPSELIILSRVHYAASPGLCTHLIRIWQKQHKFFDPTQEKSRLGIHIELSIF